MSRITSNQVHEVMALLKDASLRAVAFVSQGIPELSDKELAAALILFDMPMGLLRRKPRDWNAKGSLLYAMLMAEMEKRIENESCYRPTFLIY
jgi:hypothetical protein